MRRRWRGGAAGLVVGALVVGLAVSAGCSGDDGDLPPTPAIGVPFELEPDVELTVLGADFDDRAGRLRAEVGYVNRRSASFAGPQFTLACDDEPAERVWQAPMLEDSIDAVGSLEAESAGGGVVVVAYDVDRLAGCATEPILWIRSGVQTDINGEPGHRTFALPLERPVNS